MALTRGRALAAQYRQIRGVRSLVREDLLRLKEKRTKVAPHVKMLRDSHHNVARLVAMGLRDFEVASRSGYSLQRIYQLKRDPSFTSLVEHYRGVVTESFKESADEYMDLVTSNMVKAERMISDKLDTADAEETTLPIRELIAISRDAADRTGRGKKTTNVNINVDFASSLEKAIERSSKIIDGTIVRREG